jgi:inorganic triphosphatase YgiF
VLPGIQALGSPRRVRLEDRYLDTAHGALRAAGLVARVRTGPGLRRLTVKSLVRRGEGAVHRRLELEGDAGDGDDPGTWPASTARTRILEAIGDNPLVPLATLRQRRLQRDITTGVTTIELSLDEIDVSASDGRRERWVELEAERRSGSDADLDALGARLLLRADLAPAMSSKLERALSIVDPQG